MTRFNVGDRVIYMKDTKDEDRGVVITSSEDCVSDVVWVHWDSDNTDAPTSILRLTLDYNTQRSYKLLVLDISSNVTGGGGTSSVHSVIEFDSFRVANIAYDNLVKVGESPISSNIRLTRKVTKLY